MEDDTFLLAHHDYVWDDETMEDIGRVLKTMRYRADELWVPVTNLPISNCDFEDLLPRKPEPQPAPKVDLGGRAPRKQFKARIPRRDPTPSEGEFSCEPFLCIIEDRNNENKTAEVLKEFATQTYIIADAQSMKDYTFLLAYVDTVWDEETNEAIGEVLKMTRYPAKDVWAPITNLPIANMGFEDFLEEDEEQR
ncbi:hypothetical protein Unana1_03990 [Umbelopsis nana]